MRKTVEENQDLRRQVLIHIFVTIIKNVVSQVVFLQQTVDERDRRIRALESLLVRLELRVCLCLML